MLPASLYWLCHPQIAKPPALISLAKRAKHISQPSTKLNHRIDMIGYSVCTNSWQLYYDCPNQVVEMSYKKASKWTWSMV